VSAAKTEEDAEKDIEEMPEEESAESAPEK
jgi:hypothetical protein